MEKKIEVGSLVYYIGEPILFPQRWDLIVRNNNGVVNLDEIAIVAENNDKLKISTLYFTQSIIFIDNLSHKFIRLV